jgi:hypothetical protein
MYRAHLFKSISAIQSHSPIHIDCHENPNILISPHSSNQSNQFTSRHVSLSSFMIIAIMFLNQNGSHNYALHNACVRSQVVGDDAAHEIASEDHPRRQEWRQQCLRLLHRRGHDINIANGVCDREHMNSYDERATE